MLSETKLLTQIRSVANFTNLMVKITSWYLSQNISSQAEISKRFSNQSDQILITLKSNPKKSAKVGNTANMYSLTAEVGIRPRLCHLVSSK